MPKMNLQHSGQPLVTPLSDDSGGVDQGQDGQNPAANLIRQKLSQLYGDEPDAEQEAAEINGQKRGLSKHQQYLKDLMTSGKTSDEIDTAWHEYYIGLGESEKHAVWREFNRGASHGPIEPETKKPIVPPETSQASASPAHDYYSEERYVSSMPQPKPATKRTTRSVAELKTHLKSRVQQRQKLEAKHHLKSLLFGLSLGAAVMLVLLLGFFNERFIAPFITPSRKVSYTPIIVDSNSTTVSDPNPKVIIPKINVEIPVVYDELSIEEKPLQTALERGVVHYATTAGPGEQGNVVIFGHSSNNIFNQGDYKFAFVLLSRVDVGDTFYLTKNQQRYTYRVYDKKIVKPTEVSVLGEAAKPNSATLITCDPPGTSLNRLVVTGEQISPDPSANVAATQTAPPVQPKVVPSNAPSLWSRVTSWL